jgi:ribosomal protein L37E
VRTFHCLACGEDSRFEDIAETAVSGCFGAENYISIKDGGEPITESCPNCGRETFIVKDALCIVCEAKLTYTSCSVCGESLGAADQEMDGLCGYHRWLTDRDD